MLACALTIAIAPFTAHADPDKNESGKGEGKDGYEAKNRDDVAGRDWDSYDDWVRDRSRRDRSLPYFRDRYSRLDIPYGHYPPPVNVGCGIRIGRPHSSRLRVTAVHCATCLAARG
jgi:hypothetical protein